METMITWHKRSEKPIDTRRILVFSPDYPEDSEMRIRIMRGDSLRYCSEGKLWAYPEEPKTD